MGGTIMAIPVGMRVAPTIPPVSAAEDLQFRPTPIPVLKAPVEVLFTSNVAEPGTIGQTVVGNAFASNGDPLGPEKGFITTHLPSDGFATGGDVANPDSVVTDLALPIAYAGILIS
jgi:hypothetical protein